MRPAEAAVVSMPLPLNPKAPQPRAAKLLCEVTDLNQQTVSESRSFVRHSSDYYFGLRRLQPVTGPRKARSLPIELIAVQTDGAPLPGPAHATLRITRIEWQSNRVARRATTTDFENTAIFEPVMAGREDRHTGVPDERKTGKLRSSALVSPASVLAGQAGQYLLEAIGKDAEGHEILTSMTFYVAGAGEAVWDYRNPYAIDLVADKDSYEGGQTATLLVKTPIAGEALVTVERDRVIRSFLATLHGNAPTIEVPITADDAPNIFVSVMLLRGADDSPRKIKSPEYRVGYCELKVGRPSDKLTVYVKPSASAYRPGDSVDLNAEVLDIRGKPVAGAEVVLYAVDEGVLSLTGYKTPDPLAFYHRPRHLGVQTSLTLPTLLREDLAEADFANKGYLVGDGKGGSDANNGLRKNFLACAFWNATLHAGADGHLHAKLTAPDSLTRYRVVAIAQTKQSQFGGGDSAFEVNKPVMLEPALPRFANLGDKITLRAVLHNTTDLDGQTWTWRSSSIRRPAPQERNGASHCRRTDQWRSISPWRWPRREPEAGAGARPSSAPTEKLRFTTKCNRTSRSVTRRRSCAKSIPAASTEPRPSCCSSRTRGFSRAAESCASASPIPAQSNSAKRCGRSCTIPTDAWSRPLPICCLGWSCATLRGALARDGEDRRGNRRRGESRDQSAALHANGLRRPRLLAGRNAADALGQRLRRTRHGQRASGRAYAVPDDQLTGS